MDLNAVKKQIENDEAILLDVREKKEWDESHLKKSKLLPLSELKKGLIPSDLPKDKILYIHCRAGRRAAQAAEILKKDYQRQALDTTFDHLQQLGF